MCVFLGEGGPIREGVKSCNLGHGRKGGKILIFDDEKYDVAQGEGRF